MTLPEPAAQFLFSRIAWAVVLCACVAAAAGRRGAAFPRRRLAWLGIAAVLLQALPGAWSPAHWLGLAFQSPSPLTVALCTVVLRRQWLGRPSTGVLPLPLAAVLAAAGAWLYLDAVGGSAIGAYYLGFGPVAAPLVALVLASTCVLAMVRGVAVEAAAAVFAATIAFMVVRLPTGNLWDALLDPFLWAWAVLVCASAARARVKFAVGARNQAS